MPLYFSHLCHPLPSSPSLPRYQVSAVGPQLGFIEVDFVAFQSPPNAAHRILSSESPTIAIRYRCLYLSGRLRHRSHIVHLLALVCPLPAKSRAFLVALLSASRKREKSHPPPIPFSQSEKLVDGLDRRHPRKVRIPSTLTVPFRRSSDANGTNHHDRHVFS